MTFAACGNGLRVASTLDHLESSHDDLDEEDELQVFYNKLFKECTKLEKLNILYFKKLD
jgi:hypothetical protein